jgi:hypothetical protein
MAQRAFCRIGLRHDPAHQVVDAETGERLAAIVQENGVMCGAINHQPFDHGCRC